MDITSFFESISEIQIYRVFNSVGYQPLVAFELARICTFHPIYSPKREANFAWRIKNANNVIPSYSSDLLGYLPQGSPSSPMLANLAMRDLDTKFHEFAENLKLTYTRYSDDLVFSSKDKRLNKKRIASMSYKIERELKKNGFSPQYRKTKIIGPGTRKIVLGLLVDGNTPRLTKEFKSKLRQHLYYLDKYGAVMHAKKRNFVSVWGLKCHVRGLIDFANSVEPEYAKKMLANFSAIDWPV